mgnify:CR=1 FL=1|tara:strand:+ start:32128 stop:33177 length:1050 start_codon:yes stop_codon:yes gene_type:complete
MALYKIQNNKITALNRTTFAEQNLKERDDLQRMLKEQIEIISPDILIISEEFGNWEDSRRRIDLLGLDKAANLIVIELKRTEDGGHMELQAIRYAAMISETSFDKVVTIYQDFLNKSGKEEDAESNLLEFLEWSEPNEDEFAQEVKILLAGADFSKELTSSVMWLNEFGLDIKCIRLHPYLDEGATLLDVQTVIPLPEVKDYQVKVREKKQKEREARISSRDFTKFDVTISGKVFPSLSKRWMMFHIISETIKAGAHPDKIANVLPSRKFKVFDGNLTAAEIFEQIMEEDKGGQVSRADRFFTNDGEFFHVDGKTYVLSNQWGKAEQGAVPKIIEMLPSLNIEVKPSSV